MEPPGRKRKGAQSSSPSGVGRKRLHGGEEQPRQCRKKCREDGHRSDAEDRRASSVAPGEKRGGGTVMTAPPCCGVQSAQPGRGLKRKLGCVEAATRTGRKKKLESEYELHEVIGRGKFGSVKLCRSRVGGEVFACKTLPKNGGETVHREVEIMQHLSGHRGVVMLKAVFEDADCFHLVMEMCSGGRLLDQMAAEGMYSEISAAKLLKELVSVLKYCHDMGVVHRDIKPENILLSASGHIKLADFGLAMRITKGQMLSGLAGSPAYVAPEVLTGHYSEKVDIWGAGVLLHALLVGVLPFQGSSHKAIFEAIKNDEISFDCGLWSSVSELARDLLRQMLTRDVSARLTAEQVLAHPWILFHTEGHSKALPNKQKIRKNSINKEGKQLKKALVTNNSTFSSLDNSSQQPGELEMAGIADVVAAALSRVTISESKRTRLCGPTSPMQECSSNMQSNLLAAF